MKRQNNQSGSVLMVVLILLAVGIVGFIGYRVFNHRDEKTEDKTVEAESGQERPLEAQKITWQYDEQAKLWKPNGSAPDCKHPFVFDTSPVDVSKVTSMLYPGQTRGGHYKAHGGFAFDNNTNTGVKVSMPYTANLVSGSRYIESGEVQYLLDFVSDCGVAIRFDHLAKLSDKFEKIVDKYFPQPKIDDTRGTHINPPIKIESGELIATEIGHGKNLNVGMDFGVYDYRKLNEASQNAAFRSAHGNFSASTYHGVCWFDMLPGNDAVKVKSLPSRDQSMGKTSDYCD